MAFNKPIPEDKDRKRDSGGLATLVQAEKMMQIALLLPSAAFVGWLMGAGLDKLFHLTWIGAAGIVFGGIAGLIYVIRLVIASGSQTDGKSGDNKNKL
jgi:F0F1-type ATP synthase assembly protein I